jgi:energy-coupling factor transport system ATP-binding protein
MVQLCNGLLRPTTGEIRVRGRAIAGTPVHEVVHDVAVMFQHPGDQITERTVAREVAVGVEALGLDRVATRVRAALQLVDLHHRAGDHPYDLEASERKLVTLAATVAMHTPIVVLDEPLVDLAPSAVRIVARVVQRLRHEGRVVLFVAHDILQAWPLADRVIVLHQGRIALDRPMSDAPTPEAVFRAAGMPPPTSIRFGAAMSASSS